MAKKWWVLAAVGCGTFMATLDSSIVNIALPTLSKEFGVDLYQVKWVVVVYLLVITCLLLPFGRLADYFGRKTIFQFGFIIFTLGSALCGLAPGLGELVAARVVQGLGVSMLMANGPAIITAAFPFRERGAALGTMAMVVSTGLLSGPGVGGFLISHFGWRSIFLVNLPIGLLGILLAQKYLEREKRRPGRLSFDFAGAFLQTVFLLSVIVLFDPPNISISGTLPISIPRWIMAAAALIIGAIFVRVEAEAKAPVLDLSLMKSRTFWSANVASLLMFISFSSIFVLMPFYLEEMLHLAPHQAGLYMTVIPLTIFFVAPISGRLSDRIGSRWLSFGGALVGAVGLLTMSGTIGPGLTATSGPMSISLFLMAAGLANGLFQSPNNSAIMGAVSTEKLGVASAFSATIRNLGLVTGTGLATGLFAWNFKSSQDFISSLHVAHRACAVIAVGAMIFSLWKENPRKESRRG
ncbi:MAG TPA: MFS transporter [Bdellovibrionales bacterium]|nr:MAG: hypothetical protein A2Z97_07155 [Bdellovibrionales bacterium GWB1_52_6]OFZ04296.1 MAG: hypothetical protein A2X97_06520 [Bdellovibrionales bacterium GWA1_52_35]OFZ42421.1 MAG: hypothetical protein A2070_12285 [Bdellovibrionales bacterium GWC1_52_8]HAR41880.1 MFS transporter [Bdellovibrionales bacterium]HCM40855.1 MFS transporter [Bdellovibrionales bacterium]